MFTAMIKRIKRTPKRWRLNYVVTYANRQKADAYRCFVRDTLITAATLRRIDYAIEVEASLLDNIQGSLHIPLQGLVCDIYRFRSSSQSLSSVKEFRALVDNLFRGYDVLLKGDCFDVRSQLQKHLKEDHFPTEFFRPLSYPYVEFHNGKKTSLCMPAASLQEAADGEDKINQLSGS